MDGVLIGFLILALELLVFFASCEMMSAVSTILWNVDLRKKEFKNLLIANYSKYLLRLDLPILGMGAVSTGAVIFGSCLLAFDSFASCLDFLLSFAIFDSLSFSIPISPFSCQAASFCEHALRVDSFKLSFQSELEQLTSIALRCHRKWTC